jgi:hypothetical protein
MAKGTCSICDVRYRLRSDHEATVDHRINQVKLDMEAIDYVRLGATRALLAKAIPTLLKEAIAVDSNAHDQMRWWGPRWAVAVAGHFDVDIGHRRKVIEMLRDDEPLRTAMLLYRELSGYSCRAFLVLNDLMPELPAGAVFPNHIGDRT